MILICFYWHILTKSHVTHDVSYIPIHRGKNKKPSISQPHYCTLMNINAGASCSFKSSKLFWSLIPCLFCDSNKFSNILLVKMELDRKSTTFLHASVYRLQIIHTNIVSVKMKNWWFFVLFVDDKDRCEIVPWI